MKHQLSCITDFLTSLHIWRRLSLSLSLSLSLALCICLSLRKWQQDDITHWRASDVWIDTPSLTCSDDSSPRGRQTQQHFVMNGGNIKQDVCLILCTVNICFYLCRTHACSLSTKRSSLSNESLYYLNRCYLCFVFYYYIIIITWIMRVHILAGSYCKRLLVVNLAVNTCMSRFVPMPLRCKWSDI